MKSNRWGGSGMVLILAMLGFVSSGSPAFSQTAAPAEAATAILRVPYVITKPGIYLLKKNLVLSSATGVGITINASDVTLDLGGHVLSSGAALDNTNTSVGVQSNGMRDLTVRNGGLRNFRRGMSLTQSSHLGRVLVENVVVQNAGAMGIDVSDAVDIEIRGCHVLNTGYLAAFQGPVGISAVGNNVRIVGNLVGNMNKNPATQSYGINCGCQRSGLVDKNMVTSGTLSGNFGIYCDALATSANFVVENTVENFATGIFLSGAGKYRGNLTISCGTPFGGGTAIGGENN